MIIEEHEIKLLKNDGYIVTKVNDEDRFIILTGEEEDGALGPYLYILNQDGTVELESETLKVLISDSYVKVLRNSWNDID